MAVSALANINVTLLEQGRWEGINLGLVWILTMICVIEFLFSDKG